MIVPTVGRRRYLQRCLEALDALDYDARRYEVVVADDGQGTEIEKIAEKWAGRMSLTVIRTRRRGPSAARNAGAAVASGRFLAFTDDDCEPEPGWLVAMERALARDPSVAVGGRTVNGVPDSPAAAASQAVVDALHDQFNRDSPRFFDSGNLAVAADAFHDVGGFDENFRYAEDREFCERFLRSGRRLVGEEDAVVRHMRTLTPREFARQHYGYGRGAWAFAQTRQAGVAEDRRRVVGGVIRAAIGSRGPNTFETVAYLAGSQLATAAGYAREAVVHSPRTLFAGLRHRVRREGPASMAVEPLADMLTPWRGSAWITVRFALRNGLTVSSGPFAGMRFPRTALLHFPDLGAKLAGTYEWELQNAIEEIAASRPPLIINVGAGDGWYAVGLALRCPDTRVIAFEADSWDARALADNARENEVTERIEIRGTGSAEDLAAMDPPEGVVVISDCEGDEMDLLDPARVPWLARARLVIETHDCFRPGVTDELVRRLEPTHELKRIDAEKRYLADHPALYHTPSLTLVQLEVVLNELRSLPTPWLVATPDEKDVGADQYTQPLDGGQ